MFNEEASQSSDQGQAESEGSQDQSLSSVVGDNEVHQINIDESKSNESQEGENKEEAPEFIMPEKFKGKSAEEIAKAYVEQEKRFGKELPEKYELELPEEFKKDGIEIDKEDKFYKEFEKVAKENRLSNEALNKLASLHLKTLQNVGKMTPEKLKEYQEGEIKKLGDNGHEMLQHIQGWSKNNLSEEQAQTFLGMIRKAEDAKVVYELINKTKGPTIPTQQSVEKQYTKAELIARMDPYSTPYGSDDAYTAQVNKEWENYLMKNK